MGASSAEPATEPTMTCPTCSARQVWSDQCRRCQGDLSQLHAVWRASQQARASCLRHLRAGRWERAIAGARRYVALRPGEDASRLLTVCHLLRGDWAEALAAAQVAGRTAD